MAPAPVVVQSSAPNDTVAQTPVATPFAQPVADSIVRPVVAASARAPQDLPVAVEAPKLKLGDAQPVAVEATVAAPVATPQPPSTATISRPVAPAPVVVQSSASNDTVAQAPAVAPFAQPVAVEAPIAEPAAAPQASVVETIPLKSAVSGTPSSVNAQAAPTLGPQDLPFAVEANVQPVTVEAPVAKPAVVVQVPSTATISRPVAPAPVVVQSSASNDTVAQAPAVAPFAQPVAVEAPIAEPAAAPQASVVETIPLKSAVSGTPSSVNAQAAPTLGPQDLPFAVEANVQPVTVEAPVAKPAAAPQVPSTATNSRPVAPVPVVVQSPAPNDTVAQAPAVAPFAQPVADSIARPAAAPQVSVVETIPLKSAVSGTPSSVNAQAAPTLGPQDLPVAVEANAQPVTVEAPVAKPAVVAQVPSMATISRPVAPAPVVVQSSASKDTVAQAPAATPFAQPVAVEAPVAVPAATAPQASVVETIPLKSAVSGTPSSVNAQAAPTLGPQDLPIAIEA
ncbi:MAG: hypothetical protein II943_02770, partial [Victivallales bacterium]|nr:hypothetical protein [Victivallales bacterium]